MMNSVLPNPKMLYSFEELLEIEESTGNKYELIDGHVVAMTGGTKAHNLIALGLFTEIDAQKEERCRLFVADVKLRIDKAHENTDKDTLLYPDVMLACAEEYSEFYEENPLLVAEVLSDGTVRKDKNIKRDKYLGLSSLYAYILLSQTEMMLTVYQKQDNEWIKNVFLGRDAEVEIQLGNEHKSLQLNLNRIYKYVANRI